MANEKTIVELLYNNFLLRDLFAKIVPGSIVLASVFYDNPFGDSIVTLAARVGWAAVIILAGLAWLVGFAVQEIGELLRIIRHHPRSYEQSQYRYLRRCAFKKLAIESESQQAERYAIIKEATGNSATAILLTISIVTAKSLLSSDSLISSALFSGFLLTVFALALVKANRSHAKKQFEFIDSVVDANKES